MAKHKVPLTLEKRTIALQFLGEGYGRKRAAQECGVSVPQLQAWIRCNPSFAEQVEDAEIAGAAPVEDALMQSCLKGNAISIIFFLTNRCPSRWRDRRKEGNVDHNPVSEEKLEELLKQRGISA